MTIRMWVYRAGVGVALVSLAGCGTDSGDAPGSEGSSACAAQAAGCLPLAGASGSGAAGNGAVQTGTGSAMSAVSAGSNPSGRGSSVGAAGGASLGGMAAAGSSPTGSGAQGGSGASPTAMPVGSTSGPAGATNTQVTPTTDATGIPCDVASVVGERCTGCHGSAQNFGAPMALATLSDFQADAWSDSGRKVYEVIPERIDPADVARRMPPTSLPALSADDKDTLLAWVGEGAPGVEGGCEITETSLVPDDEGPATVSTTTGGAHIEPIEYDDPDMECYKFVAHAAGSDRPYSAAAGEAYINFSFAAPWQTTVYQRAIKVVLDENSQVIHHWLLFKLTGRGSPGSVATGIGAHPDGILLHGWAPGASPVYLDPDVGVKLEANVGYMLEAHYYNSGFTSGPDQSGAEVCVTPTEPEHIAELSWLGTDSILGTSASGTCSPSIREPVHLIVAQPHMHLMGRHMKVVINRSDRTEEVIHDEDFSFENQRYYVLNSVLNPGESITTTCSYNGVATFGTSTNSEMCYFFTLHWPAGALRSVGVGTALHGANSCL